jgi:hypothetical protein
MNLKKDGYILFKNCIDPHIMQSMYSNMNDTEMNYTEMKVLIDQVIQNKINKQLHWNAQYIKFRVSDNNNSVDASAFHRDVFNQTTVVEEFPCFTCVMYLDKTVMEIIPGTHLTPFISYLDVAQTYQKVKQLFINPGDVLVFYSTLIHRGIFTEKLKHRRVIQVFEVFDSPTNLNKHKDRIVYKLGDETHSEAVQYISKTWWLIYLWNLGGYLNSATGYGILNNCNNPNMDYLSPEGVADRITVVENTWQPLNKYYIIIPTRILQEVCVSEYNYVCHNRNAYMYMILLLVIIFCVVCVLYLAYRTVIKQGKMTTKFNIFNIKSRM